MIFLFCWLASNHLFLLEKLEYVEPIGTGVTATVYRGKWSGKEVAIKKFHPNMATIEEIATEVAFLTILESHYVLNCLGACLEPPNLLIVSEFFEVLSFLLLYLFFVSLAVYMKFYIQSLILAHKKVDFLVLNRLKKTVFSGQASARLNMKRALSIALDVAKGLQVLHSFNVCHRYVIWVFLHNVYFKTPFYSKNNRDIKSHNILVSHIRFICILS